MALEGFEGEIRHLIEEDNFTHKQCADYLGHMDDRSVICVQIDICWIYAA